MIAAILHDVVEDTAVTVEEIKLRFGEVVAEAVDALTRRDNETYAGYIKRLKPNHIARKIKLADLRDNLGRIDQLPPHKRAVRNRYQKGLVQLSS